MGNIESTVATTLHQLEEKGINKTEIENAKMYKNILFPFNIDSMNQKLISISGKKI